MTNEFKELVKVTQNAIEMGTKYCQKQTNIQL